MTSRSLRWSSISFTSVSIASAPNSSLASVYASSMNSAPPSAVSIDLGGLQRGLTDVAGHQLGAIALDEVALREEADGPVDPRDESGDRGLARAGVADEHEVAGEVGVAQALRAPQRLDAQELGLVAHLRLHRLQPDQRVELGEQLLEAPLGRFLGVLRWYSCVPTRRRRRRPGRQRRLPRPRVVSPAAASCALPMTVAVASAEIVSSPSDAAAMASCAMCRGVAAGHRRRPATSRRPNAGVGAAPERQALRRGGVETGRAGAERLGPRRAGAGRIAETPPRPPPRLRRGRSGRLRRTASSSAARASASSLLRPPQRLCGSMASEPDENFSARKRPWAIERVGVGPARGVEEVVHLRPEQVELVAEHRERGLAARDGSPVGEVARQPQVRGDRFGQVAGGGADDRVGLHRARTELVEAAEWSGAPCSATRSTRASTRVGHPAPDRA